MAPWLGAFRWPWMHLQQHWWAVWKQKTLLRDACQSHSEPVELTDSCFLPSMSDTPRRNARWLQPTGKAASNRPVHSSWILWGRGQNVSTSHFLPSAPRGDTCSKPMIMLPRNTSNTSGWFRPSQGYWYIPLWEWQCHYSWRSMSKVHCQNCYLGVSFTLINDNIKICAKRSGKTLIDSHPNALLGNSELLEFIWVLWHAVPAWTLARGLMAMSHPSIHTPVVFSTRPQRLSGTRPLKSNITKVVFGHKGNTAFTRDSHAT